MLLNENYMFSHLKIKIMFCSSDSVSVIEKNIRLHVLQKLFFLRIGPSEEALTGQRLQGFKRNVAENFDKRRQEKSNS